MGLDIYVGSLTRYYTGGWETVVQTFARETGVICTTIRLNDPPDAVKDADEARAAVLEWRAGLFQSLGRPLCEWDEGPETPYFTDKPAWDGYTGLMAWAAYDEHPELVRPANVPEDLAQDPAYALSSQPSAMARYPQLLLGAHIWLPCPLPFVFEAEDCPGNQASFGSSVALAEQLRELNRRTWGADDRQLDDWRREGCEYGSPLEETARFGFAIFLLHAELSVLHRLPMLMDW